MDTILVIAIIIISIYIILRFLGVANIYKVKTGSMENRIHAGDYILIYKKKKYNVGDVVTYKKEDYYVTHRIIKINGEKIITKGDANNTEDQDITTSEIVGRVIYIGGILNILINYKYSIGLVLIGLYLISCYYDKKPNSEEKKQEEEKSEKE